MVEEEVAREELMPVDRLVTAHDFEGPGGVPRRLRGGVQRGRRRGVWRSMVD
jgi:hypothetical protein